MNEYLWIAGLRRLGNDDDEIVVEFPLTEDSLGSDRQRCSGQTEAEPPKRDSCLAEVEFHVDQPVIACHCKRRNLTALFG